MFCLWSSRYRRRRMFIRGSFTSATYGKAHLTTSWMTVSLSMVILHSPGVQTMNRYRMTCRLMLKQAEMAMGISCRAIQSMMTGPFVTQTGSQLTMPRPGQKNCWIATERTFHLCLLMQ
ncbi:hypothetical protein BJY04DRAFT_191360 [Aspergillus karnatakaensis]|uniref:uncharacterized protein n=1 Tax=Aspergillus karnatakaensis TaxID=1810916 RepID=UPI003CCE375E